MIRKALVHKDDPSALYAWQECVWEDLNDAIDDRVGGIVKELLESYRLPWQTDNPKWYGKIWEYAKIVAANAALAIGGKYLTKGLDLGSDFLLYLDSEHGQKIRDRLKNQILGLAAMHPEGIALVAHSLGSVIAYDAVAEAVKCGHPLPVVQLITFGSPLDWTFGLRKAEGKRECAYTSIGETKWTNFYYAADYVPIHAPLPVSQFPTVENRLLDLPKGTKPIASHTAYWTDAVFAAEVKTLIELRSGSM